MGGPAQKGEQLSLMINNTAFFRFAGYDANDDDAYNMSLKSSNDWMQYVIHIDQGTLEYDNEDTKCDGKQLFIHDLELQVDFTWFPPSTANGIVTLTVGYAPFYTLISVQSFQIRPKHIKTDDKTEL